MFPPASSAVTTGWGGKALPPVGVASGLGGKTRWAAGPMAPGTGGVTADQLSWTVPAPGVAELMVGAFSLPADADAEPIPDVAKYATAGPTPVSAASSPASAASPTSFEMWMRFILMPPLTW